MPPLTKEDLIALTNVNVRKIARQLKQDGDWFFLQGYFDALVKNGKLPRGDLLRYGFALGRTYEQKLHELEVGEP